MNAVNSIFSFEVEPFAPSLSLEESLAEFLDAENARCGTGIPVLPALDLLDWGRVSAGLAESATCETTQDERSGGLQNIRRVWLLMAAVLLVGASLGTCLGLMIAVEL